MNRSLWMRLVRGNAVLELIELRRAQTGDRSLGTSIERQIIDRELMELEAAAALEGISTSRE